MIAVDTSALMAIVLDEPEADACITVLARENDLLISAGTMAEALVVAARRNIGEEMARLIDGLGLEIVAVTPASARRIAQAYGDGEVHASGRPQYRRLFRIRGREGARMPPAVCRRRLRQN